MSRREEKRKKIEQFIEENGLIWLDNVTKVYSDGYPALNGVSLKIKRGEFVFITGDSGAGKTTLIELLFREIKANKGTVWVMGHNVAKLSRGKVAKFRRNLGIIFQDFRLLKDRNVYENVAFAQRIVETPGKELRKNVPDIIATVGLPGKYKAYPDQLSGGEKQRVAIARALVNKPAILLADEPTGNLDPKTSWEIMKLLEEINKAGTTVIVITHDREMVNAMQKRVVTLKKGTIVSDEEEGEYIDEN